jgi:hypothetical protein
MERYQVLEAGSANWLAEFYADDWDEAMILIGGESNLAGATEDERYGVMILIAADRDEVLEAQKLVDA